MNAAFGRGARGLGVLGFAMCVFAVVAVHSPGEPEGVVPEPLPFATELLRAIRGYEEWERPTDRHLVAPQMCRRPPPVQSAAISIAIDSSPHGRKLYYLYVRVPTVEELIPPSEGRTVGSIRTTRMYGSVPADPQAFGQVIVKKSFVAEEVDYDEITMPRNAPIWYLMDGRQTTVAGHAVDVQAKRAYRAGEQRELFVMMKLDPATPGTDNGWVYGVLSPDGKQVLNSGRIESCMECHVNAPHDRLFGLK